MKAAAARSWLVLCAVSIGMLLAAFASACSRQAEVRDEPAPILGNPPGPPKPDGGIPTVAEQEFQSTNFTVCEMRPEGECVGPNDFECSFEPWVQTVAEDCLVRTGCRAADWLRVELGDDGCVARVGMVASEADFLGCLIQELASSRCRCDTARSTDYYLGAGAGCGASCGTQEFPCPDGGT